MVIIYPSPLEPQYPQPAYPMEWIEKPKINERHVKEVKKGIMMKFDDGSWMFIATDDECYEKIRGALDAQ